MCQAFATACHCQAFQLSPAQARRAQALVWAWPKLCQRLFLTGFRGRVFGPETPPFGSFLAHLGLPCRCAWLFWRVGLLGAQLSPAQPTSARTTQRSPAQPSPAQPSPAQPSPQPSPAQPRPQPLVWALSRLCQRLFLTGFRGPVFGPETAPFLVRFWPVWGRRAAVFGGS